MVYVNNDHKGSLTKVGYEDGNNQYCKLSLEYSRSQNLPLLPFKLFYTGISEVSSS